MRPRLGVGVEARGRVAGLFEVIGRLLPCTTGEEMLAQNTRELAPAIGEDRLDGVADLEMKLLPLGRQQASVGDLLDQGVLEDVLPLRRPGPFADQPRPL